MPDPTRLVSSNSKASMSDGVTIRQLLVGTPVWLLGDQHCLSSGPRGKRRSPRPPAYSEHLVPSSPPSVIRSHWLNVGWTGIGCGLTNASSRIR